MKNKPYPYYTNEEYHDLKQMVYSKAEKIPDKPAFSFSAAKNTVVTKTFKDFCDDVEAFGTYLLANGYSGHTGIIGENSYEWLVAFFAIVNMGAVSVPIAKDLSADEIAQLIEKADCNAVLVSKSYTDLVSVQDGIKLLSLNDISTYINSGLERIQSGDTSFINSRIDADKMAAIFFTSGTTGSSKGVMLSHKNMISDTIFACRNFRLTGNSIAVLPFNHTFGLITAIMAQFNYEFCSFINKSTKRVSQDLLTAKPVGTFMVPLFIETFYRTIMSTAEKTGKLKKLQTAEKISNALLNVGIDLRKNLFKSVRNAFGGNMEYIICGGAPLEEKYVKKFRSWGVNLYNGYGITECSPVVSVNRNSYWRDGSVGPVLKGCEVRIAADGEVLVKGDNVMLGYYNDEQSTAEALVDGWYHTGDLGHIDTDGFLFLTGRKKNLIILSNGENVSPEEIEARILNDDAVSEVVVYDDGGQIVAEIYPTDGFLDDKPHFDSLIRQINEGQPKYKQVSVVKLRKSEFQKNATKKIIRYKVKEEQKNV